MQKHLRSFILLSLLIGTSIHAASSINSDNRSSYGANIGWMDWRTDGVVGISIGEFICSGYIYGANVGWINVGSGNPANQIQYQNDSETDFGLNYTIDPAVSGQAMLRGYAYGEHIGWINFEATGNPRIRFSDGRLQGYAYSANCGWINLGDGTFAVQTDFVAMGIDTDADGIADAFEWQFFGSLDATAASDFDGDGVSDLQEYLNGSDPNKSSSALRITAFTTEPGGTTSLLTWNSTTARLYRIETTTDLVDDVWTPDPTFGLSFAPDAGSQTTRTVIATPTARRFYRVQAMRPLAP